MGYYEGQVADFGCNNNNGFAGGWEGLIALALVFGNGGLFGNGFGGGRGGYGSPATVQDVASGFSTSEIMSDLNDIILGQSQGFANVQQTLCQGFSGVNATVTNGFTNLNTNLASMAYNTQSGFNTLSREIADCCCSTARNIDSLRFDMSKGFCDVIRANQDNTNAIIGWLTQEKIAGLQAENAGLKAQISNDKQSAYLLSELKEYPKAAYIVPNPNCCYNYGVYNMGACGASVQ